MRNRLRYLIPFILVLTAFAFTGSADIGIPIHQGDDTSSRQTEMEACNLESPSSSCSVLNLPSHISGTNTFRQQCSAKRAGNAHRSNLELAQACKSTNTGTTNFTIKESLNIRYHVVKPASMLISLGKLII